MVRHRTTAVVLAVIALLAANATAFADDAALAGRLDAIVKDHYPAEDQPGLAVIVMVDGKPVMRKGYGMADLSAERAVTPDMVFRIGSITKQFTAVAVLQLVQAGKVALDDPVTKYVDFDTQGQQITIEHLLTHTSGIPSVTALPDYDDHIVKDMTPAEVVGLVAGHPLEFSPGSRFAYSNTNYILLGMVIEKASGQRYADYVRDHIATPAGLKDTRYGGRDDASPRHARGYEKDESGDWGPARPMSMSHPFAAGALESTVDDLAAWTIALSEGKLLDPALLERAWTPYTPTDRPSPYGYGWSIRHDNDERWISHGGGINGFVSNALWIPEKKVFVAVLSNAMGEKSPDLVTRQLALEAVGRPAPRRVAIDLPAATLDRYVGVYRASPQQAIEITREGQKLFIQPTGKTKLQIFPEAENRFFARDIDLQVVFNVADGKAMELTITRAGREMMPVRRE